ncbi:hypothetical protein [uncultured Desulfuromonas sp.]|uniref:hypothetical protein n=1 Tax=uncultured Desulfuromonas sp. TaxID=181013 RepID=UPI002AAA7B26|nr:hypothetical protein [uncultured Desulfuromonas sp.]
MIGLMILAAFALYLALSYWVVSCTVKWARRTGHGVKRWAAAAILFMYLLMFWDHIPTLLLYHYYCDTKAGFWVYKTPEQWKTENPGVAETLTWRENSPSYSAENIDMGYRLNERFAWVWQKSKTPIFPVGFTAESIVDLNTDTTVVKRINVWAGYTGSNELFRFWTAQYPYVLNTKEFGMYINAYKKLGREVK